LECEHEHGFEVCAESSVRKGESLDLRAEALSILPREYP
jgi:hypothetical protein